MKAFLKSEEKKRDKQRKDAESIKPQTPIQETPTHEQTPAPKAQEGGSKADGNVEEQVDPGHPGVLISTDNEVQENVNQSAKVSARVVHLVPG